MSDFHQFALAAILLLLTPGPTNTLLATGGATVGVRRAWHLVIAEVAGYALSIGILEILIVPLAGSGPVAVGLRVICALYLALTALRLWRSTTHTTERVITWSGVLFATLCNPKVMVFAVVILPSRQTVGWATLLKPYGATLLLLIAMAGTAWVLAGSVLHDSGFGTALLRRTSSVVIAAFSAFIVIGLLAPHA